MNGKSVKILVAEDDDVDFMAIQRSFAKLKIANEILRAIDGLDALKILRGGALTRPYIILLDLNMPRMDGFEFLKALRSDPKLRMDIVFVLTTSRADEDKVRAYAANVAGYIVKAEAGKGFIKVATLLRHYWRIVELP